MVATIIVSLWPNLRHALATTITGAGDWLTADIRVSRSQFLVWILLGAVLGSLACWPIARRRVNRAASAAIRATGMTAIGQPNLDSPTLTEDDRKVITLLARLDGAAVESSELQQQFGWGTLVTQRIVGRLLSAGYIEYAPERDVFEAINRVLRIRLTRNGIELAHRLGLLPDPRSSNEK